jgi:hypothetical protein
MPYFQEKNQIILFIKLFIILFVILFLLPGMIDNILSMFMIYEAPKGSSLLVSKNLYENWSFGHKYLFILKNLIINL